MGNIPIVETHTAKIPAIGLGTWQLSGETCVRAVIAALECGYRHVDTAKMYGNETEVGQGLKSRWHAAQSGLRDNEGVARRSA
jgi:diketogulonate reductase-like aldo/keto reductase